MEKKDRVITIQPHITEHELPKEVIDFVNKIWLEHLSQLEPSQLLERVNIQIPLRRNSIRIETVSADFIYDREKGIEQFLFMD